MESFKLSEGDELDRRRARSHPMGRAVALVVIFAIGLTVVTRAAHPVLLLPTASLGAVLFWLRRKRQSGAVGLFDSRESEEQRLAARTLQEDLTLGLKHNLDDDLSVAAAARQPDLLRSESRDPGHSR